MKRPQIDFIIPSIENEDKGMVLHFTSVEEIDSVIESLEEARAEFEHLIEMKRIKNREKKLRRKVRRELGLDFNDPKVKEKLKFYEDNFSERVFKCPEILDEVRIRPRTHIAEVDISAFDDKGRIDLFIVINE